MKNFFRPRTRTILFASLALLVGWFAWTEVSAESQQDDDDQVTINAAEFRRELDNELKRHSAAVEQLQKVRQALEAAKLDTAAVDRLINAESSDHAARERKLRTWLDAESAQTDDATRRTRSIINQELRDLGKAIGSLNQSFRIAPISSRSAESGGSRFVDYEDDPDFRDRSDELNRNDEQSVDGKASNQKGSDSAPLDGKPSSREPQSGADKPLGDALYRELPRDPSRLQQPEDEDRLDRLQRQVEELSRQLTAIQQQLSERKSDETRK
ncbi:MAG: hypothetical protein O3B86_14830 [Planctomycetota bacterium]|nr:hypothetical protein [Planctomycetota bacterium]